jgi:tRNA (cmo5U34)-methyltransferase
MHRRRGSAAAPAHHHPQTAEDWDPHSYGAYVATLESYGELQAAVVEATRDRPVAAILDLGSGTGETARRLLAVHRRASLVCYDANQAMLDAAATNLPSDRTTFVRGRLEGSLPPGPFDLVVSVLAVHHLDGPGKAELFAKIGKLLSPGGRFVLGDFVLDPNVVARLRRSLRDSGVIETGLSIARRLGQSLIPDRLRSDGSAEPDRPSLLADQIAWMTSAGLKVEVVWKKNENLLVVVVADMPA